MIYEAEIQSSFIFRWGAAASWVAPIRIAGTPAHNDRILADVVVVTEDVGLLLEFKQSVEHYGTEWEKLVKGKLLESLNQEHHLRPVSDSGHWLVTLEDRHGAVDHILDQYTSTLRELDDLEEGRATRITFAEFISSVETGELGMSHHDLAAYVELLTELGEEDDVHDVAGLFVDVSSDLIELHIGAGLRQLYLWMRNHKRRRRFSEYLRMTPSNNHPVW